MQQYDPITVQRMLELLPQIERRKRKAKNARKEQSQFDQMRQQPGSGNYVPTQHGGLFQTVAQYQKDYKGIGNQIVGALGSYLTGKQADKEELAVSDMSQQEQLRALEQLQRNRDSKGALEAEGGANNAALRGYLGLLGNETDMGDLFPKEARVSSTKVDSDGNIVLYMSDGTERVTGRKADYNTRTQTDAEGNVWVIGNSGAGRGNATPVTFGGSPAPAPGQTPPPAAGAGVPEGWNGAARVGTIDGLTPELQQRLQGMLRGVTDPVQQDMIVDMFMRNNIKEFGPEEAAGGTPAQQLRVATKGQEAFDAEQGKIAAQLAAGDQVTQMEVNREGAKRRAVVEADRVAEIRAKLPTLRANVDRARTTINQLVNHPGLKNITGRLGGMIPDPDSFPGAYQLFKSATAGTATGNALAMHEQLRGQVFAVAFETLKGGGQITQIEGQKATEAAARMTRAQSTEEYKKAAAEFVAAYEEGLRKLEAAGRNGYFDYNEPAAPAAPSAADPRAALRAKYGL